MIDVATEARLLSAEDLQQLPLGDGHVELVRGVVISMPPSSEGHSRRAGDLVIHLGGYLLQNPIGKLYVAEGGFILARDPDIVRAPDIAFVALERVAAHQRERGYFDGAPDLAVEVVSPDDSLDDVTTKVLEYLSAGARMVWVVLPKAKLITVYRSLHNVRVLTTADNLDGEDVLPGFKVAVKDLFD